MNKVTYPGMTHIAVTLLATIGIIFCQSSHANGEPQEGSRYKIVGLVYFMASYDDLNNRRLSRETARASVHSALYAKKANVALQCIVPVGTIMTIVEPASKVLPLPFFAARYFVRLNPMALPIELDVILELNREIDGNLDGLNPKLFARADEYEGPTTSSFRTSPPCVQE